MPAEIFKNNGAMQLQQRVKTGLIPVRHDATHLHSKCWQDAEGARDLILFAVDSFLYQFRAFLELLSGGISTNPS